MHELTLEKARDLGRLIGQTEEYKALDRARKRLAEERETTVLLNRLAELEAGIAKGLEQGEEPSEETAVAYEHAFGELQGSPVYQSLVAAQSNFDKLLARVNDEIGKGMEAGAQSRIILPD